MLLLVTFFIFSGPQFGNLVADGEEEPEAPPEEEQPIDDTNTGEVGVADVEYLPGSSKAANLNEISDCPLESGVVYTQWGAIQAGTVIASIAAGYERQEISTSLDGTAYTVDSRYGASLAGKSSLQKTVIFLFMYVNSVTCLQYIQFYCFFTYKFKLMIKSEKRLREYSASSDGN